MTDSKYECTYTITEDISKEYYRYFFFKRPVNFISYIIYVLFIIYGVFMVFSGSTVFGLFLIIIPSFSIGVNIYKYNITKKKNDNYLKTHPSQITLKVDQHSIIAVNAKGESNTINTKNITKICESKNLIFVYADKIYMIFKKDAFVNGNYNSFKAFIKRLCADNKKSKL